MTEASIKQSTSRQRKPVVAPAVTPEGMSLFDYLRQCTPPLDQKIIDIACSASQVPPSIRDDAGQEIRMMWHSLKPDTTAFKPGQIAAYAHRMACHAALRARRDLGSSVRLPGSAFRKRKDGSSYVTPGVLAAALDWDKLEGWMQLDGNDGDASFGLDSSMREMDLGALLADGGEPAVEQSEDEQMRDERQDMLGKHRDSLTPQQFSIMESLIGGSTYEEIMAEFDIKRGVLMRELAIVSTVVGLPGLGE